MRSCCRRSAITASAPSTASSRRWVTLTPGSAANSRGSRVAGPHSTTSAPSLVNSSAFERATRECSTPTPSARSEEHTSELQSRENLVCRLLLEKKNKKNGDEEEGVTPRST